MPGLFRRQPANGEIIPSRTRMVLELRHNSPLLSCRFDPTGRYVFAATQDNTIQRWELANQAKVPFAGHRSWVRGLAFHAGTRKFLSGDYTGKVLIWTTDAAQAPQPERIIEAHQGWVRAVVVSPDSRVFVTCGNDNLIKLWDFTDYSLLRTFEGHDSHVYNVAFHPNGRFLMSADLHGNVKQWDVQSGAAMRTLDATVLCHYDPVFRADHGGIRSMAFNADGSLLACSGITNVSNAFAGVGNPAVVLFNFQTGLRTQVLRVQPEFQGTAWGVLFHSSGLILGAGAGRGGGLWFWRPDQQNSIHSMTLPSHARDLAIHPDRRRLAIPYFDGVVRIYELS